MAVLASEILYRPKKPYLLGYPKLITQYFPAITYTNADQPINTINDPLDVSIEPITRSKTKTLKEALNEFVLQVLIKANKEDPLEHQKEALVHLIQVQEGSNPTLFEP